MTLVYRRINILDASNGANRHSGFIARDAQGMFKIIVPQVNISGMASNVIAGTNCSVIAVNTNDPTMSFVTFIRMAENGDFAVSAFDGVRLRLMAGEPATVENIDNIPVNVVVETVATNEIAIKSAYTQTSIYSGFSGYHSNQGRNRFNTPIVADKPWRIGVELELYAKNREAYDKIVNTRTNWFQCESDNSLTQASYAIEMKTIPLRACDAKSVDFWDAPMTKLKELAKSKNYSTTGLHVHIGKEIFGSTEAERAGNIGKLQAFYVYLVESDPTAHAKNVAICGREQGYGGYTLSNAKTEVGDLYAAASNKKAFCDAIGENGKAVIIKSLREKGSTIRWDINTQRLDSYGTVEFRKGKGIISKVRMAALITWWEQMILYCNATPLEELNFDAFFRKVVNENPCVSYFFNQDDEC